MESLNFDLITDEDVEYEGDASDLIDDELDDAFFATQEEQEEYNHLKDNLTVLNDEEDE